ncbi:MAG: GNAT family N-acetyltransferase [Nitrospira sp.]|nr:GNAT family N-acetyltransferase [Nitrospira sp.]
MPPTLKPVITFSEKKDLSAAQLVRLFHQAPWATHRTIEDAKEMLRHTDVALCAWDGDLLVGFGRVLTDFVYRATIWDVIVDKAYQKQGIGTAVVQRILDHPRLKKIELFWLCTRRPGFYERLGFSSQEQTGWSGAGASRPGRNNSAYISAAIVRLCVPQADGREWRD